jgi:hypothetical protein
MAAMFRATPAPAIHTLKNVLTAGFAAMWLIDTTATVTFVALHGISAEANPLMRALIEGAGIAAFAITKAGLLAFWLSLQQRAPITAHIVLFVVMLPVTVMAMQVAWGVQ